MTESPVLFSSMATQETGSIQQSGCNRAVCSYTSLQHIPIEKKNPNALEEQIDTEEHDRTVSIDGGTMANSRFADARKYAMENRQNKQT